MQLPLQITFEGGLEPSEALRARIEREVAKLERVGGDIMSCHVAIIGRGQRQRHGGLYAVRLQVTTPRDPDIVIDRNPPADHAHEDAFVTIRDAFAAARRKLQDRRRIHSGQVKLHEAQPRGRVVQLNPVDAFGLIEAEDGRQIYFHRNSVLDGGFDRLRLGSSVRFAEEQGDKGPQASTVHVIG